jgi:hypothetical protein
MYSFILLILASLLSVFNVSSISSGDQKNDTRRRQDMARITTMFTEYQSNNAGKIPQTSSELDIFIKRYITGNDQGNISESCIGDQFCDPDGLPYRIYEPAVLSKNTTLEEQIGYKPDFNRQFHEIHYFTNAKCGSNEGDLEVADGKSDYVIMYVLENDSICCYDNQ